MKKSKYYVLYDENDFPILYFHTLKEFSNTMFYNYDYLKQLFCKHNSYINLQIQCQQFRLYKFVD